MSQDKSKAVRSNINVFYRSVEMPGGWHFDHLKTLKLIELMYNSKFESGEFDNKGFKKFFFNIVKPACDIASKYIDLDTKDINLISEKSNEDLKVWLLSHDLKQWMKEEDFGKLLNEIVADLPKYGSVVLKKSKGKVKKVNLHNLRFDPTSESLESSPFVCEIHLMTRAELLKMPWDKAAKKEVLAQEASEPYIKIYECYEYNLEDGKKWNRTILGDLYCVAGDDGGIVKSIESSINNDMNDVLLPGIVLHEDQIDELPYREVHWERIVGRWLGRGFVELLTDNQIAENEAENLERKALYWKALQIFQTRDESVGRNIMTDVENGDILKIQSEVTPVAKENSDLAAFNSTRARWSDSTQRLTFSFDISRGENLPSRTPLGVANIQASSVVSFFEGKQEVLGLFLRQLILNDVIPDFKYQNRKHHLLTVSSDAPNFEKMVRFQAKLQLEEAEKAYEEETGFIPNPDQSEFELSTIEDELRSRRNLRFEIPDGFYDDAKFTIDVLITGEQLNLSARNSFLQFAIQTISSNPAVMQNKGTRTALFKLLESGGLSPVDLDLMDEAVENNPGVLPQGGSMTSPGLAEMAQQSTGQSF